MKRSINEIIRCALTKTNNTIIKEYLLTILNNADRIGSEKDEPEGTIYIQISDTLVNEMISKIREIK